MESDINIKQFLEENYVVVQINNGSDKVFDNKYAPNLIAYPWLSVLDKTGKLLVEQRTGHLEEGSGHNSDRILTFLKGKKIVGDTKNPQIGEEWKQN